MFEDFLKDFLKNFKDYHCMAYEDCKAPPIIDSKRVPTMGADFTPFKSKIKEGHKILVFYRGNTDTRLFESPISREIQHGSSVIIKVETVTKRLIIEKIRETLEIKFDSFPYLNTTAAMPGDVFYFPSNAEMFFHSFQ